MKKLILVFFTFLISSLLFAQNVKTGGDEALSIKGFISTTLFLQNQSFSFGNGQNTEWPVPPEYTTNRWFMVGMLVIQGLQWLLTDLIFLMTGN